MISPKARATRSTRPGVASRVRSASSRRATSWPASPNERSSHRPRSLASASRISTSAGSNQRPLRTVATSSAPAGSWALKKTSTVWARPQILARSGTSSPLRPSGWPLPSQCSSRDRMARAVSSGKPMRRVISAPRSQRICMSSRDAFRPPTANSYIRPALSSNDPSGLAARRVERRARQAGPVDGLHLPLEFYVVGVEEGGHLGGVARTAGVLEQEGVEERRTGLRVEPEPVRHPHPDQARPNCVALGLPLDEVENPGERREHLGEPELPP